MDNHTVTDHDHARQVSLANWSQENDLAIGAKTISELTGLSKRQVYHLHRTHRIPTFNIGDLIAVRPSTWFRWIEEKENQCIARNGKEADGATDD